MPRMKRPSSYSPTKIKAWREFRGLTQEQLAGRLDEVEERLTPTSISRIENGKQGYTQATLEAIAGALDVSPSDLLEVDPPNPAKPNLCQEGIEVLRQLPEDQRARAVRLLKALAEDAA